MADNSENKGDASQVNLEEHDRKYHDGAYKGGKCKYRTDHGIPTKPAPEGADMKSTGDGEEAVATKAEKDVDTADKGKKKGKGGEKADRELQRRIADVAKIGRYTDAQGRIHPTRIFAATGKPCSQKLNSVINRLLAGDPSVTDDEVNECPEWQSAFAQLNALKEDRTKRGLPSFTAEIDTPQRDAMRDAIVEKFLDPVVTAEFNDAIEKKNGGDGKPYEVEKGRRIDIITGLPAAGKSTVFARRLSLDHKARLVDSDEIKKRLPEYQNGVGADCVHEESSQLNVRVLREAAKRGENIVYPILGYKPEKLGDMIQSMKRLGYSVHLHLNELDAQKAKGRMLLRFVEKNRFIPLSVYAKTGNKPTSAYEAVKGMCDGYDRYRSDTGTKAKPTLVESVNEG